MSDAAAFQLLKVHYFAWLDASAPERAALMVNLEAALEPGDFSALKALISQSECSEVDDRPESSAEIPSARIGARFGAFEIRAKLGGGGMGEVYLAERVSGGFTQAVALKLMRPEFASRTFLARFERERNILARLSHPNIAGLVDGGLQNGVPWFAMAFVEGQSLTQALRESRLNSAQKLSVALQIAEALAEAHRKLVIHRDLKPSNVMLDAQGNVKLLDFGIGKLLDDSEGGVQTESGLTPMTLRYASPEQLSGEPTSTSTDIYQLGLLLSEMLLGTPTRDESSLANARNLAVDVRAVLRQALAPTQSLRYASASDFAADLRRLMRREAVSAMPAKWHYRARRFVARNRALTLSLIFAGCAIAGGVVSSVWQARQAQRNASAVLELLSVAAPQTYGERAPELVRYLVHSADQLEVALANEPEFLSQALTQIGNGLINLDDAPTAQKVLLRAHSAALRAGVSNEAEFQILRLLAYSLEPPTPLTQVQALSQLILKKMAVRPTGAGVNALASMTATLSRYEDHVSVAANLGHIDKWLRTLSISNPDQENILRQLGKIALREQNPALAQRYFASALALYEGEAGAQYSAQRIAEGHALLAQAALAADDIATAEMAWRQASAQFQRSYAPGNNAAEEFIALGHEITARQAARPH